MKLVSVPLNFHLAEYDGPLDLLLDLIRKQEINIYDIPIASITAQYLEYVQKAMELDIELSSDFVYMAATLIHIKSRLLLPRDPELDKIAPEEDPRQELVQHLIQHQQFKNAAEMLQQKRVVEEAIWSNPQIHRYLAEDQGPQLAAGIFDLVKTFQGVLERAKNRPTYDIDRDRSSVPEMMRLLRQQLSGARSEKPLSAAQLFDRQPNRNAMICLFLAILEMVKRRSLLLTQVEAFGDIGLLRGPEFDDPVSAGEPDLMTVEQEYQ